MGISFGSGAVKPYVGGSEIQEAYVGSQLVYKSGLPYYYYFLGGTENYQISENCLLQDGAAIAKPTNVNNFMIAVSGEAKIRLNNINSFIGYKLKFTTCARRGFNTNFAQIRFHDATGLTLNSDTIAYYTNPTLVTITIPANAVYATLRAVSAQETFYFDTIRCEEE